MDSENLLIKKRTFMTIEALLEKQTNFFPQFMKKCFNIANVEERGFLKIYALMFSISLHSDTKNCLQSLLKSKDID